MLTKEYMQRRIDQRDKIRLRHVKAFIDNKPPRTMDESVRLRKKKQDLDTFYSRIEYENRVLLDRVTYIKTHDVLDSHNDTMRRLMPIKTQHRIKRKKVLKEITEQNYALQRRIDTARPTIDVKKMKKDHEHHKKVLSLMSRFKQNIPIQNRRKLSPMKSKSTKILHNYDRSVNFSADEERNYYTDHPSRLPPLENKRQTISEEEQERLVDEAEENLMLEDYESERVDVDVQVDEEEIEKSLNDTDNNNNNNQENEEEKEKEEFEENNEEKDALDMINNNDDIPLEDEGWDKNEEEENKEEEEKEEEEGKVGEKKSEVITIDDAIVDDLNVAEEVNPLEDSIVLHATELHEPADNIKPIPGISEEVEYILPSHNKYDNIEVSVIPSEYIDMKTGEVLYVEDEEEIHNKQIPGISEEIDLILPKYRYDERDINDLYMLEDSTEFVINGEGNEEDIVVKQQEVEKPQTPPSVPGISEIVDLILPYKRYDDVQVVYSESEFYDPNDNNKVYEGTSEEFEVDFPPKQFTYEQPVLSPSELIDIKTGEQIFPE